MMKWTDKDINILLIDNDEDNYILTQHFLTDIDDVIFNLDWAKNYTIGLDTIIQQKHDVYLIDYHLGPDNGLSLLKEAIKNGCRVPLILLTGQEDRNIDLAAMKVGAAGFLAKDQVNASVLERSIRYAIEGKRTEAKLHKVQNQLKQGIETQTSQLKKTNAILKEKFSELEHLKQQIQNSLERRTRQVETGTDIAQKIATTPDPKDLFYRVINLVQARFGYYHVHLYTIENNQLIMQEGTAKAGQQMKNLGHKIPLDAEKSLVAQVAREKEAKLVSDV